MLKPLSAKSLFWQVTYAFLFIWFSGATLLAGTPSEATPAQGKPLVKSRVEELASKWAQIKAHKAELKEFEARARDGSDLMAQVLERRSDKLWEEAIKLSLIYCDQVADLREHGYIVSPHDDHAVQLLDAITPRIEITAERLRERIKIPDFSKPALEQIAIDRIFFDAARLYRHVNLGLLEIHRVAERFGLDREGLRTIAIDHIETSAVNTSVFLDLAVHEVSNLRASLTVMPDDAELKAKLRVAEIRVRETIRLLTANVETLTSLDISATEYRRQLLAATGSVTTVSLDVHVFGKVLQDWWHNTLEFIVNNGPNFLFQTLFFLLIVYLFYKLSNLVRRLVDSALQARHLKLSRLMQHMIASSVRSMIIVIGILIALSQFNISIGPMLAGLGLVGFIVGFALQDSLSNFASGLMILFYEPFDVGDSVVAGGERGKVSSMSLVNTTIRTFDNQSLIIPNNKIWQDVITNITDQRIRRVDMEFGISYDEDVERVETILHALLETDERVLNKPEARVLVGSFGDSSVNVLCRPWVKTDDYWEVLWDMNKRVKQAFDREGVTIPFPQRDVHLYTQPPAQSNSTEQTT